MSQLFYRRNLLPKKRKAPINNIINPPITTFPELMIIEKKSNEKSNEYPIKIKNKPNPMQIKYPNPIKILLSLSSTIFRSSYNLFSNYNLFGGVY